MPHQSESARTEQIITQFQLKALHAILTSRIPHLSSSPLSDPDRDPPSTQTRKRDRWFNLALGNLPDSLLHDLRHGLMDPFVVDVIISPDDVIAERWTVTCEPPGGGGDGSLYRRAYKKSIILFRSLYSILRLLPCFKIYKALSSSTHSYSYDLSYRVSSFAAPFSRDEEERFKSYSFTPIETQFGYLSLSVIYRSKLDFEVSSLISPMIITDYVGSPAADRMRSFPPSPAAHRSSRSGYGSRPIPNPVRGATGSNSESRSVPIDVYRNRIPSQRATGSHHNNGRFSFDEFRLSPPLSSSPTTPSPPGYWSSSNSLQSRLRSETSPVSIPMGVSSSAFGKSQLTHRNPNHSDPMRSFLPPLSPSPRSTVRMEHSPQRESPLSERKSFKKSEGFKLGDFYSNLHLHAAQKGAKDGRDDSGRLSGIFSASGSPRLGFSRSSSRLSVQDDLEDSDFSYPFAVDDVDTNDSQTRNFDGKDVPDSSHSYTSSHKSQDAAVGALVHMLRTAAPLRQEHSYSSLSSRSELNGEIANSSFFVSRRTSDALEELRTYREMKGILLSQSQTQLNSETE